MRVQDERCVLCHNKDLDILIPANVLPDRVAVLKCRDCDLVFLESRAAEDMRDAEEETYWDHEKQKAIYLSEDIQRVFEREFEARLDRLETYLPGRGKLLDVGCGVGHFLNRASRRGWKSCGLDISKAASLAAKEKYGLDVRVSTLEDANFHDGEFDAISLWDVIEHIRRPMENLEQAYRLLRKGGVLILKTPNENGLFKRGALFLYRVLGRPAAFLLKYVYYVPHYFSYSEKSLGILLKRYGFQVLRVEKDVTPREFAAEKIKHHYRQDPRRHLVIALLPVVSAFAALWNSGNKLVVYARK